MRSAKAFWLAWAFLFLSGGAAAGPRRLVVGVVESPPYAWQAPSGAWQGLLVAAWESAAVSAGLKWEYRRLSEAEMLAKTADKGVDILVAPLCMLPAREAVVDFSAPVGFESPAVAVAARRQLHPWLEAMAIFFSWGTVKVLLMFMLLLMALGVVFWFVEQKRNPEHFGGGFFYGAGSGIYWVGATLASGLCLGISLKSVWGRILGVFWMFVCAIALSAFTASLASVLTARKIEESCLTLSAARSMRLGAVPGDMVVSLMRSYGLPAVEFADEKAGLAALCAGRIDGFAGDENTLNYFAGNGQKIDIRPVRLRKIPFGFAFPLKSPLRKKVNQELLKLMQDPRWDSLLRYYGMEPDFSSMPVSRLRRGLRALPFPQKR